MINYNFLKTLNILYIQNDETIKNDFLKMVNTIFDNIICVNNGKDGVSKFKENKNNSFSIDVIISDIDIPDIDGIKILEEIRKDDLEIPLILITNNQESKKLLGAIKFNATDYLPISVSKQNLIVSIQKACIPMNYDKFKENMEEELEKLISAINDVALVTKTDLNGNISFANKYFCDTSGYTKKEIIGQNYNLIRADKTETIQIKDLFNTIKQGKVWEGKMKYISKTKDIFFGYLTIIPVTNPLDNNIKEYMWIRFLSTEEEIEQSEFKKKVVQNIHSSRRINLEARAEIDILFKELDRCKTIDFVKYSLYEEKKRTSKFMNQIAFYKKEKKSKEENIRLLSERARVKMNGVVLSEKKASLKKDEAVNILEVLVNELDLKNKNIKELIKELNNQVNLIDELNSIIIRKEKILGLT